MKKDYFVTAIGIMMLIVGLYFVKNSTVTQGLMRCLPYIFVGFGCGAFGHGMGNIFSKRAMRNNPILQKEIEIAKSDERNISIVNRAKGRAFDVMTFVFGALMVSFALMNVDMVAILLLVFAYLFIHGVSIYYQNKYEKEM